MTADPIASLRDDLGDLALNLAQWSYRDTTRDKAAARRAASAADAAMREDQGGVITMGMYLRLLPGVKV